MPEAVADGVARHRVTAATSNPASPASGIAGLARPLNLDGHQTRSTADRRVDLPIIAKGGRMMQPRCLMVICIALGLVGTVGLMPIAQARDTVRAGVEPHRSSHRADATKPRQ